MQNLMIDDYGVTELSLSKMQDIDGGFIEIGCFYFITDLFILIEIIFPLIRGLLQGALAR